MSIHLVDLGDNDEKRYLLECYGTTNFDHLFPGGLCDSLDWFGFHDDCESNFVRSNMELGAHLTSVAGDYCLGAFSAHHGWVMDLGIILAHDFPMVGDSWIGGLDAFAFVQFDQRKTVGNLSNRRKSFENAFWFNKAPGYHYWHLDPDSSRPYFQSGKLFRRKVV